MASKTVTVGSAVGLHARPAAVIAAAAGEVEADVQIALAGGDPVDASSSLMIMTLGAEQGAEVTVTSDDEAAAEKVAALVEQDLDA
ncbi:HPr family phosphocarrier protein [Kytococcus sedentarius]|uniref:HPr family phosphocarrier protein n=1 Tax=Kytococcus sedentarius TaxID=1276 RepID=UPI00194F9389|nr:HPr family phosphocarrier protein [Kytococcus sedentarius]QRO86598.1 HPr family phosphocarrier protein [Kytococcus sedentarius]